jgi:hypothetical protein
MGFVDPATKLSEPELDREKARALIRMSDRRHAVMWKADTAANRAYNAAHVALLMCRTEEEVARVEGGFAGAMAVLLEALDVEA